MRHVIVLRGWGRESIGREPVGELSQPVVDLFPFVRRKRDVAESDPVIKCRDLIHRAQGRRVGEFGGYGGRKFLRRLLRRGNATATGEHGQHSLIKRDRLGLDRCSASHSSPTARHSVSEKKAS